MYNGEKLLQVETKQLFQLKKNHRNYIEVEEEWHSIQEVIQNVNVELTPEKE